MVARITEITAVPIDEAVCWTTFISVEPSGTCLLLKVASAADMIGIMVMPMPRPWTNSAPHSSQYGVSAPRNMNVPMPTAIRTMPTSTNLPGPILSVILPATGMVIIAPIPCGANSKPAARVLSPRIPMKYCGYSSAAPKKAIMKNVIVMTAMASVLFLNRRRSSSGWFVCSACQTNPMIRISPMIDVVKTLVSMNVPASVLDEMP